MKAKDVVCIDTHILVWGVRRVAEPGQEIMIERAEHFLDRCLKDGVKVLLPAIVLGELVAGTPPDVATALARTMQKRFMVAPFDARAAEEFGRMWHRWKENHPDSKVREWESSRQKFRLDHMILATAITRGAWCIYSHDPDVRKLSDERIEVFDLPEMPPRQEKLL